MTLLEELEAVVSRTAESAGPAVVGLGRGWGVGSGVVVAPGRVLTNAHNLRHEEVSVRFADGRTAQGRVAGADSDLDVAVVEVDTGEVEPVQWPEEGTAPAIGRAVLALSNPGGRGLRVTPGFIASTARSFRGPRGRRIAGAIEHTAPLPRGSSGGPIVDAGGRLVGINTHRVDSGFYLALPTGADFRRFVERAAAGEVTTRRSLGIAVVPPAAARRMRAAVGLPAVEAPLIRGLDEEGPAGRAGLRRGDQILRAGDVTITTVEDLQRVLADAGSTLALRILRGTDEIDVQVDFDSTDASGGEA
jgi:serine protease Do